MSSSSMITSVNITLPLGKMPLAEVHERNFLHNIMPRAERRRRKKEADLQKSASKCHTLNVIFRTNILSLLC